MTSGSVKDAAPFETISRCRIGGAVAVEDLLFLGDQPLANSLKNAPGDEEWKIPLTLAFCPESNLLQLKETVKKEVLFSHYLWVSGTSETTRRYAGDFARRASALAGLKPENLVLEVASNDGTFLAPFAELGFKNILGVDPAANIAAMAEKAGIPTWAEFWNRSVAARVKREKGGAHVAFARNVIAHVSELAECVAGIADALAPSGVGIFEFHYAGDILNGLQYDSIYHEHLCYFSFESITRLLKNHGMAPFHVETSPISGGSIVVYFSKDGRAAEPSVAAMRETETKSGVNKIDTWRAFAKSCVEHKAKSQKLLKTLTGQRIVGFGASARSSTYMNYCGMDSHLIAAMIDNNPLKKNKFTPGTNIPIVPFEEGLAQNPDVIFITAWNFSAEIMAKCRQAGFRGRFLTAFPSEPRLSD